MNDVLDSEFVKSNEEVLLPTLGNRIVHFVVDYFVIYALYTFLLIISDFNHYIEEYILIILAVIQFTYYVSLESLFGITLGKLITTTKVIREDREKPSVSQIALRNIVRFIPFEFLTLFTAYSRCLHDLLSKTWVVRINKTD